MCPQDAFVMAMRIARLGHHAIMRAAAMLRNSSECG
jgi:hypothetical protein